MAPGRDAPYTYLRGSGNTTFVNNGFNNQIISNLDLSHQRETIYHIDSRTNNYPLTAITRNQNDLAIEQYSQVLYETDLIELKNPMGFILYSDKSVFQINVYAYDANKVLLQTEQQNFQGMAGGVFYSGSGTYTFDNNVGIQNTGVPLFPNGVVKYIKYKVRTGLAATIGQTFNSMKIVKLETVVNQTPMKTINRVKEWTSTAIPTKGYFEIGDFVLNVGPSVATVRGWRRITTGTNHVLNTDWKEVL